MHSTVTLHRTGKFPLFQRDEPGRCASSSEHYITYHIWLTIPSYHLDSHGFVIEHNTIHDLILSKATKINPQPTSCEKMAILIGEEIIKCVPRIQRLRINLAPTSTADVSVNWDLERG